MPQQALDEEAIFQVARRIEPPEARAAYLDQVCGADRSLHDRILALLGSPDEVDPFLETPPSGCFLEAGDTTDQRLIECPGVQIGPYKLLQQIGEGGMGTVFMAEQEQPVRRRVALKVIKPGMDSRLVIARFEAERQALAIMDHVNIARVLDAGTTEQGRPYFVMELVHGVPITKYCDDNHLTPRQRLELFVHVCQAIQHAHTKGIIHRDIKPSNVMITLYDGKPVPKVIDFGVAKATEQKLTERTLFTHYGTMVGTLEYMSPEQAEMSALGIDTRSDIYSLGVLLYELLTGSTPLTGKRLKEAAHAEILRMIKEEEPPKPSTRLSDSGQALASISAQRQMEPVRLAKLMRGELDWIVMKTLEKDRNRRYETASGFAADVERYLNDEAVEACPPSAIYRLRKLARRNRTAAITTTLVALSLILGTAVSTWQAVRATQAEGQADSQREIAERSAKEAKRQTTEAVKAQGEAVKAQGDALRAEKEAERQRNEVSQNLYYADARVGLADWTAGNVARLSGKLLSHVPKAGDDDLRGWEWYYLLSLCHQDERTMHQSHHSVAWSPDGRYLASTDVNGTVNLYDSTSWRIVRTKSGQHARGACWSPDGQRLAWATTSPEVCVWEVESDEIKVLRGHTGSVWTLAWSPDGKYLASGGMEPRCRIWEPATGSCIHVMDEVRENTYSLAWHPNGKLLASVSGDGLMIRDTVFWEVLRADPSFFGIAASQNMTWSPDGKQLALGTSSGKCQLYDGADCSLACEWQGHAGKVSWVAWNSDGSRLVTAGADRLIRLWDPANGSCLLTLRGHLNQVNTVAWEPNGRRLVSGDVDGLVKVWPLPPVPQPRRLEGHPDGIRAIAWCEDGATLRSLGGADGTSDLWNLVDWTSHRASPRTRQADGTSDLWNLADGQCLGRVMVPGGGPGQFGSGGKLLAIATTDEKQPEILIYDSRSGELILSVKKATVRAAHLALAPDASKLALANEWGTLEIVDLRKNEVAFHWQQMRQRALSWSPDGQLLAIAGMGDPGVAQYEGWVHVFDNENRRVMKVQHGGGRLETTAVGWSPNGQRLVSGDISGRVEIWEVPTGNRLSSLDLHIAAIKALAWSPDGRRVASGSMDGALSVWDPAGGEELMKLDVSNVAVTHLEWSRDGRRLAAATADDAVYIWDASVGYEFVHSDAFSFDLVHEHLKRASQLWETSRNDEALALHEQILKENEAKLGSFPMWVGASLRSRAGTALAEGRNQEAVASYQLLAQLHNDDASHFGLGKAFARQGQVDEAIACFREAIRLGSELTVPSSLVRAAIAWQEIGKLGEFTERCNDSMIKAIQRYESSGATDQSPLGSQYFKILNNLACYLLPRDPATALKCARKATELAPNDGISWNTLAVAHYRMGDWKASVAAFEKCNGGDGSDWFFLAIAHWKLDEQVKARKWYNQAVEWMDHNRPQDEELGRFREEAAELLRVNEKQDQETEDLTQRRQDAK